jgi:hypothetical protein
VGLAALDPPYNSVAPFTGVCRPIETARRII